MSQFVEGLLIAVQGMLIVFAVLAVLMLVLYIMKLFAKDETSASAAPAAQNVPVQAVTGDTDELTAVISAAVAACSGNDPTKRLRVMSITHRGSGEVIWKAPQK